MSQSTVVDQIVSAFNFLTDQRGFKLSKKTSDRGWADVRYTKPPMGVIVTFEGRDQSVFVELCRLAGSRFPPKPGERLTDVDRVELAYVLAVRAPDRIVRGYRMGEPPPAGGLQGILAAHALNLKEVVGDFLDGSLAALNEASPGLRHRAEEINREKWGDRRDF